VIPPPGFQGKYNYTTKSIMLCLDFPLQNQQNKYLAIKSAGVCRSSQAGRPQQYEARAQSAERFVAPSSVPFGYLKSWQEWIGDRKMCDLAKVDGLIWFTNLDYG